MSLSPRYYTRSGWLVWACKCPYVMFLFFQLICPLNMDRMTSDPWTAFYHILIFSLSVPCWLLGIPVLAISVCQAMADDGQLVQQAGYSIKYLFLQKWGCLWTLWAQPCHSHLTPSLTAPVCGQRLSLGIVGEFSIILFGFSFYDALVNHLTIALGYHPVLKLWASRCHAHNP